MNENSEILKVQVNGPNLPKTFTYDGICRLAAKPLNDALEDLKCSGSTSKVIYQPKA